MPVTRWCGSDRRRSGAVARAVAGFTLVEMLVALVLGVFVGGVVVAFLVRQQRFYHAVGEVAGARERVYDATTVLVADLRGASSSGDTIRLATDTAVELFTAVGASTVCAMTATGIVVPPDTTALPAPLTSWVAVPDTGDYALVFHDSSTVAPARGWLRLRIAAVSAQTTATACPSATGFTAAADVGTRSYEFTLGVPPLPVVRPGSPVRFVRRGRYSVYRASDGQWYLGYRRCNAIGGVCGGIQPVSGPYATSGGRVPLAFRYYTSSGAEWSAALPVTSIARIDVAAHATTRVALNTPGFPKAVWHDSATASVAFRDVP